MSELQHRLAVAALLAAALLTAIASFNPALSPADNALPLVLHRQFMQALLGLGLLLSAFVPGLRLAAIGGALPSNMALLALVPHATPGAATYAWAAGVSLVPLLFAAAVFAREAWLQARWDGVIPSRQET